MAILRYAYAAMLAMLAADALRFSTLFAMKFMPRCFRYATARGAMREQSAMRATYAYAIFTLIAIACRYAACAITRRRILRGAGADACYAAARRCMPSAYEPCAPCHAAAMPFAAIFIADAAILLHFPLCHAILPCYAMLHVAVILHTRCRHALMRHAAADAAMICYTSARLLSRHAAMLIRFDALCAAPARARAR